MVYCESCGAANTDDAIECFACHRSLLKDASVVAAETQESAINEEEEISSLLESQLAGQRYKIVARVGTGGFGAVYKAIDVENNQQPVAIKEIKLSGLKPQEMIEATDTFNREVQILAPLSHPNLPHVYAHFTDADHWYLVMDYIEGQTLESYLEANGGKLSPEEVLAIGLQLCTVLDYLHTREPAIIFRDLKPANVMLSLYRQVYLIDFGTARLFKPGRPRDTIAFGSPGYAAPEQYGKAQTTPRADIYSLGALLHHMLTGRDPAESPFQFALLRACDKQLPADLEKLIARMVEQEVGKRPESAAEVKKELERCSTERTRGVYAQPGMLSSPIYQPGSEFGKPPPASWATSKPSLEQVQKQLGLPVTSTSANYPSTPSNKSKIARRALVGAGIALTIGGSAGLLSMMTVGRPQLHPEDHPHPDNDTVRVYKGHAASVRNVAWARTLANGVQKGPYIASASLDKTVQIWEAQTGVLFNAFRLPGAIIAMAWSADGRYILSSDGHNTCIWNVQTGSVVFKHLMRRGESPVTAVAWSQNSRYFAMAGKAAQIFDMKTKQLVATCRAAASSIYSMAWAPHVDTLIAMGGSDGEVYQWNPLVGAVRSTYSTGVRNQVYAIAWSVDGRYIASAHNSIVRVWDSREMTDIVSYTHHVRTVTALAWSAWSAQSAQLHKPLQIASASLDGTVHIWNPYTGEPCFVYKEHHKPVRAVAWEPGGSLIASAGDDKKVRVWNASQR
jgi:serine/threonine protein kinase